MLNYIEFLGIPVTIAIVIVGVLLFTNIVGELLEFKGKIVPEFIKIRKYFKRKKNEKNETTQTLKDIKNFLNEVGTYYSADSIMKRNEWMQNINNKVDIYDKSIVEIGKISENLSYVTNALKNNTKMTEEMFVQSSRDRIIDFATKVGDENSLVSREEFNRIFKVYDKYEKFLDEHEMTNGEINIAYRIITESYEERMKSHNFIEDICGYNI